MFSRLVIIVSILFLLIVPGIATGCNSVSQEGNEVFINGQIPPIDRQIHERTEIATFALG
jgi:competence protein ComGC